MISQLILSTLRNFFGTQFHQDWDLEADDPDTILKLYIEASTPQQLQDIGQAILEYMQGMDDAELDRRLYSDLYCYYNPHDEGLSAREWLRKVASMLMENEKPSS